MSCTHARRPAQAGFTLIELMVVVAIIGTFASLSAASLSGWRNNARAHEGARKLLSYIEETQSLARSMKPAELLRFTPGPGGFGMVQRLMGTRPQCLKSVFPPPAPLAEPPLTFEILISDGGNPLQLTPELNGAAAPNLDICFDHSGRTYTRTGATPFAVQTDLVVMRVARVVGGVEVLPVRRLLLEPGGKARMQR